jgi:tripartite-type tricarboxylate transporter receptor subunit TctC
MSKLVHLLAAVGLAGFAAAASAQQFPNRPITLVVPYQAGGAADAIARSVAEAAAAELGQPIIIDNKAGAEGQIGTLDVAKAPPDGYRLLLGGAGSLVLVPALRKTPPYDAVKDFTPVAGVSEFSFFMYVHPSLPAKNMVEFVNYAKANPGKINYATGNNQGLMSMAYLSRAAGLDMVKVPYKGETAAVADLITNRVQAIFATTSPLPYVKTGQLRVLATTLTKRSNVLPDVPTMKEAGMKEVPFGGGWVAIFGPAGMPKDVVDRLSKAFIAANNRPEIHAKMDQIGLVPSPLKSDELGAYVKAQTIVYRDTVRDMKMPME